MANEFDREDLQEASEDTGMLIAKALDSFCTTVGIVKSVNIDYDNDVAQCEVQIYAYTGEDGEYTITCDLVSGGGWGQSVISVPQLETEVEVSFLNGRQSMPFVSRVKAPDYTMIDMELVQVRVNRDSVEVVVQNEDEEETARVVANNNGIIFNNGGEDGLVLINQLTEKLNGLVDEFNNHKHTVPSGSFLIQAQAGVANPAPVEIDPPTAEATEFSKDDYENTKILQ